MVAWSRIEKVEQLGKSGKLEWTYRAYATVNGKSAGSVSDPTKQGCQNQIDHWKMNPDEWVSQAMRLGFL